MLFTRRKLFYLLLEVDFFCSRIRSKRFVSIDEVRQRLFICILLPPSVLLLIFLCLFFLLFDLFLLFRSLLLYRLEALFFFLLLFLYNCSFFRNSYLSKCVPYNSKESLCWFFQNLHIHIFSGKLHITESQIDSLIDAVSPLFNYFKMFHSN